MGKLSYSLNVSLDGFVETPDHGLDWVVLGAGTPFWPDLDAPLPLRSSKPTPSPPVPG